MDGLLKDKNAVAVVDTFFGDSGKGKVTDWLASLKENNKPVFSCVYRPNGGPNTGHTINVNNKKHVFHLIPSAVLIPGIECFIGKAVAFEPGCFFAELKNVLVANPKAKVYVDSNAHVIMPWHIALDNLRETVHGKGKIGTTGKGVGPCMETRCARKGFVTVGMLNDHIMLKDRIEEAVRNLGPELDDLIKRFYSNTMLINMYNNVKGYLATIPLKLGGSLTDFFEDDKLNVDAIVETYMMFGSRLFSMTKDVVSILRSKLKEGNKILVEGTQGAFLDIEHGSYPYVTAGLTTRSGLEHDAGLPIDLCLNVVKAYGTRVGNGPFPTEILDEELANKLRDAGNEYGSTTGRPRRVGWLDAVALRHALDLNSRNGEKRLLVITKLDVLKDFEPVICDEYIINNKLTKDCIDMENARLGSCKMFKSIGNIISVNKFEDLNENARNYLEAIEIMCNAEVVLVGNGPGREDIIVR